MLKHTRYCIYAKSYFSDQKWSPIKLMHDSAEEMSFHCLIPASVPIIQEGMYDVYIELSPISPFQVQIQHTTRNPPTVMHANLAVMKS